MRRGSLNRARRRRVAGVGDGGGQQLTQLQDKLSKGPTTQTPRLNVWPSSGTLTFGRHKELLQFCATLRLNLAKALQRSSLFSTTCEPSLCQPLWPVMNTKLLLALKGDMLSFFFLFSSTADVEFCLAFQDNIVEPLGQCNPEPKSHVHE